MSERRHDDSAELMKPDHQKGSAMSSTRQLLSVTVLIVWSAVSVGIAAQETSPVLTQNPDAVIVYAAGTAPCSVWLASRGANLRGDIRAAQLKAFLYGYATAVNVISVPTEPSLGGADKKYIDAFLDRYCAENPEEMFLRAVQALIDEIHPGSK